MYSLCFFPPKIIIKITATKNITQTRYLSSHFHNIKYTCELMILSVWICLKHTFTFCNSKGSISSSNSIALEYQWEYLTYFIIINALQSILMIKLWIYTYQDMTLKSKWVTMQRRCRVHKKLKLCVFKLC